MGQIGHGRKGKKSGRVRRQDGSLMVLTLAVLAMILKASGNLAEESR